MDKIDVTAFNEDGTISYTGRLNKEQAGFILNVGINYLLAEGANVLVGEDDDDEEEGSGLVVEGNDTLQ